MNLRLLETKFHIPPPRPGGVVRSRLTHELDKGFRDGRKLTLVSAPAGYGKTTLIAGWLASLESRTGWLSLDEADNDPARFLMYFFSAFQRLNPTLDGAISLLGSPALPPFKTLLDELINDLAGCPERMALVLDDAHVLSNARIHEALEYLVDHLPPALHLVITTRSDPSLPLARLRARGQMTEIRAHDLRFTAEEALEFFHHSMCLDLTAEVVSVLESRTEGWAAGLQLSALALQNQPDPQAFVQAFHGGHRFVLDYLAEEVIRRQPEEIRQFMAQTCVLDRMNASLCEALTGRRDSQALLTHLEQANLFLIPLDDERVWYRYHHLFADFLRVGLTRGEAAELLKKASGWHEGNDLPFEAVRYALSGSDLEFAADVIERALQNQSVWSGGQIGALAEWIEHLPSAVMQRRPVLSLHASRIMYLCGRQELAERFIDQAEQSLSMRADLPASEREMTMAYVSLYRGGLAALRGEVKKAVELTTRALSGLPAEDLLARARASYSLGLAYDLSGAMEKSERAFLQTSELAQSAGVLFLAINVHGSIAQSQIARGKLSLAEQTCRQAMALADEKRFGPLGLIWSILGSIALERDDLTAAESYLRTGIDLSRQGGLQDDLLAGLVILARLRSTQGNLPEAIAEVEKGCAILQAYQIPRLSMLANALLARLRLANGQKESAVEWARMYQVERHAGEVEYLREFEELTLGRILLANGEFQDAPPVLNPVLEKSLAAGRNAVAIEAMVLQASLAHTNGDRTAVLNWLGQALRLAGPEKSCRVFLDEGFWLVSLLPQVKSHAPQFVEDLLAKRSPSASQSPGQALADPLSEQETRVLGLIVAGKSNAEIAAELFISVGTAKWHVHHVLQKLGVGNRPQAIARARELGF